MVSTVSDVRPRLIVDPLCQRVTMCTDTTQRERQCQAQLCFVAQLERTRVRWKGDHVHTTRLETGKQMCRSATVSSLCTIQHSPSAWAGFAPKLTVTLTVAEAKSCFRPHSGPSSCAHWSLGSLLDMVTCCLPL